jgi:CRP-like cAMP-binding protein
VLDKQHIMSGGYFGDEIVDKQKHKREYTVTTTTPSRFLSIDTDTFTELLGPLEQMLTKKRLEESQRNSANTNVNQGHEFKPLDLKMTELEVGVIARSILRYLRIPLRTADTFTNFRATTYLRNAYCFLNEGVDGSLVPLTLLIL